MSYLNITGEAAWSLVLSKDPSIRPKRQLYDPAGDGSSTTAAVTEAATRVVGMPAAAGQLKTHGFNVEPAVGSDSSALEEQQDRPTGQLVNRLALLPLELPIDMTKAGKLPARPQGGSSTSSSPSAWSLVTGVTAGAWLTAAEGPTWHEATVVAAREAAAAHRQLMGQLEQRRAALLQDIGQSRDLDLKRLLKMVQVYTDGLQDMLTSGQHDAQAAFQQHARQLAAAAEAAMTNTIEAALAAARKAQHDQISCLEQGHASKLQSARLSSNQQLTAALQLQQQRAQQELDKALTEANNSWAERCKMAEAAMDKQATLRAAAEHECMRLRTELEASRKEAATWRARWERECSNKHISNDGSGSAALAPMGSTFGVPRPGLNNTTATDNHPMAGAARNVHTDLTAQGQGSKSAGNMVSETANCAAGASSPSRVISSVSVERSSNCGSPKHSCSKYQHKQYNKR